MPDLFGYDGELQDSATGLLDLRARWYDPTAGQFFSRDPLLHFMPYRRRP